MIRRIMSLLLYGMVVPALAAPQESDGPSNTTGPEPAAAAVLCPPNSIAGRIAPPPGFHRVPVVPSSFGSWLRRLPLRPGRPDVRLYDGRSKSNQAAHHAVLDLDVGDRDLQQCADAVIRLRAEYLFAGACRDEIRFNFTSGDTAWWRDWRTGERPVVRGNTVRWESTAVGDESYASFRDYLETVFMYAGSASLEEELLPVADPRRPEAGNVYIQGGFPGHAVIVVDVAEDAAGQRVFLLAQSYMPAQDIHILKSFEDICPWYRARAEGMLRTPEWRFDYGDLMRFADNRCETTGHTPVR